MADYATIKTSMWDDEWFFGLDVREKLLWTFLLSTGSRTLAGVYHLPLRKIMYYNSSYTEEEIRAALARFQIEGKIHYERDWIVMRNHFKNQNLRGPKHWGAVQFGINEAPEWLRVKLLTPGSNLYIDLAGLSEGYVYSIDTLATKVREGKVSTLPSVRVKGPDGSSLKGSPTGKGKVGQRLEDLGMWVEEGQ